MKFIESSSLEENAQKNTKKLHEEAWAQLKKSKAIIVPGGFGARGIEGKINALKFVRENKIPMLGICYGMQLAVIEFNRNVLGYQDSTSEEIDKKGRQVIINMPEHSTT